MRRIGYVSVAVTLVIAGLFTAFAVSGGVATTGTVTACATSPAQTVSANGVKVGTITPKSACATATYTVPTVTETVTTTAAAATTAAPVTTAVPTTTTQPLPAAGTANLWVDTTAAGSCVTHAAAAYDAGNHCGSFDAAYAAAAPGDTVAIQPGSYPAQTFSDSTANGKSNGSAAVTFCVASGDVTVSSGPGNYGVESVVVRAHDLVVSGAYCGLTGQQADHLTVPRTAGTFWVGYDPDGITQRNITITNIHSPSFFTNAGATTLEYSEIGPNPDAACVDGMDDIVKLWWHGPDDLAAGRIVGTHVLFNYIHDGFCSNGSHVDGIQVNAAANTLIEGNRIANCSQLFYNGIRTVDPLMANNVARNNMFEEYNGKMSAAQGGGNCADWNAVSTGSNWLFENNTLEGRFSLGFNGNQSVLVGNIVLGGSDCDSSSNCDHNVFTSAGTDGTNAKICTPRLASGSLWAPSPNRGTWPFGEVARSDGAEFHLSTSDTCAAGAGSPTAFPAFDIDGKARTVPVWAGADQP